MSFGVEPNFRLHYFIVQSEISFSLSKFAVHFFKLYTILTMTNKLTTWKNTMNVQVQEERMYYTVICHLWHHYGPTNIVIFSYSEWKWTTWFPFQALAN